MIFMVEMFQIQPTHSMGGEETFHWIGQDIFPLWETFVDNIWATPSILNLSGQTFEVGL